MIRFIMFIAIHLSQQLKSQITLKKLLITKKGHSVDKLLEKENKFGIICFVSNLDEEDLSIPYSLYKLRWEIEVYVKLEKTSIENNAIRTHGTIGALGVRFLSHVEMVMVSRIYFKLKELGLLSSMSIKDVLTSLGKTFKTWNNGQWVLSIMTKKKMAFLGQLGIL